MPGLVAHYIFGQKVLKKYPDSIKELVYQNKSLFDIGLEGPDIFFYYKPLKNNRVTDFGNQLHDKIARSFFLNAVDVINNKRNNDEYLTYILGFLCHFTLDSKCHGYIEKKIKTDNISHVQIEWEFERFLMELNNIDAKRNRTDWIKLNKNISNVIACFYDDISTNEVYKSIKSIPFYDSYLTCASTIKRLLVTKGLSLLKQKEKLNLVMNKYPNKKCFDSNLRLNKLMNKSVDQCLNNTQNFLNSIHSISELSKEFNQTFGPNDNWENIIILPLEEEEEYEIEI